MTYSAIFFNFQIILDFWSVKFTPKEKLTKKYDSGKKKATVLFLSSTVLIHWQI